MIAQIVMPSMGATGDDIVIAEWLVKEGDFVKEGQQIFVAETDKATTEVEAFRAGYIRKILVKPGEAAVLGDALAIIADSMDEPLEEAAAATSPAALAAAPPPLSPTLPSPPLPQAGRIQASPLARRLAKERGIDLAAVKADGPIHKRDVLNTESLAGTGGQQRVAFSLMRRAIAVRTLQSKTQSPHFYVTARIDMTEALALQRKLAAQPDGPARPTVTDLMIRAAAMALRETPELNSSCQDDQIVRYDDINVGLVIGLPEGMIIPVIRQADAQDIYRLAATTKRLRDHALAGTLSQTDLAQGTFTISNLGMFGVESFIAVINPPEAGILALGAIQSQPAVVEDRLVARWLMTATLSADHRVADGVAAARFLGQLRQSLENPAMLLPATKEMLP
jgi:pyruvate dehydrogenase E2 component (dihydrolipoamide acetyltransferase)